MQSRETPPTASPGGADDLATAIQNLLAAIAALAAQTPSGGAGIAQHIALAQAALDKRNPPPAPAEEPKPEEPAAEPASEPASENTGSRSGRH